MAHQVTAVRDWLGNESAMQATISYEYELNGNQSISATILPSRTNKVFIDDITELWTVIDHFGVEQKIIYLQRKGEGSEQIVQIKGVPLFFDVLDTSRIYDRYDEHMTAQLAFTRIFDGLPFAFVLADSFDAVDWEGFGDGESRLESFKRALDRYGAEFRIVGNTVYLHRLIGRDLQVQYRHRLNASNITLENDASGMWTYAKGFGDYGDGEGGEDWQNAKLIREYTSPLAKIPGIGVRHAPPIKDGRVKIAKEMDAKLKTLVDESLKVSVTADIHDLRKHGYPIAQPEVGDRVFLIDERIGLDDEVRVVDLSLVLDWRGDVRDIRITFGTPGLTRRHQARVSAAIDAISDALSGRKPLPISLLDQRVQEVSAIINGNTDSVFKYTPNGVIGWNGDNPNYMTRYVGDAIGFSKDGGATYRTAMSAELGIVADYITSGTLRSITIAAVDIVGSSLTGNTITGGTINGSWIYSDGERGIVRINNGGISATDMRVLSNGTFFSEGGYVTLRAGGTSPTTSHVYLQSAGEVRATLPQQYSSYINVRANQFLAESTFYSKGNAYIGDVNTVFASNNGYAVVRSVSNSFVYLQGSEIRATAPSSTNTYVDFRAKTVLAESTFYSKGNGYVGDENTIFSSNNGYVVLRSVSNDAVYLQGVEARATKTGDTASYVPMRASSFPTGTSLRQNKTNIEEFDYDALSVIKDTTTYRYHIKGDEEKPFKQLGLMVDETPRVLHGETGDSIEMYALGTFLWRGLSQLARKVDELESRLTNEG